MAVRLTLVVRHVTTSDRRRRPTGARLRVRGALGRYGRGSCMRLRRRVGAARQRFRYPLSPVRARIAFEASPVSDC
jgi:hypothetical protein